MEKTKHVAFLRGINVGGHHKVPMSELKLLFDKWGYSNGITLLNSGNIIFDSKETDTTKLEQIIGSNLENSFGFSIPTHVRSYKTLQTIYNCSPFSEINITKNIRCYISFLNNSETPINLPWSSDDGSYRILSQFENNVLSVLDVSVCGTSKAMDSLEKIYGKNITTRNWNTIEKITQKV